jgi:hypothetical protein
MTNATVIRVVGAADGSPTPHDGRYVTAWDWNTNAGTLSLTSTANRDEAALFSPKDALEQWRQVSRIEPRRPWDGKPNRPLTAITVELVPV